MLNFKRLLILFDGYGSVLRNALSELKYKGFV